MSEIKERCLPSLTEFLNSETNLVQYIIRNFTSHPQLIAFITEEKRESALNTLKNNSNGLYTDEELNGIVDFAIAYNKMSEKYSDEIKLNFPPHRFIYFDAEAFSKFTDDLTKYPMIASQLYNSVMSPLKKKLVDVDIDKLTGKTVKQITDDGDFDRTKLSGKTASDFNIDELYDLFELDNYFAVERKEEIMERLNEYYNPDMIIQSKYADLYCLFNELEQKYFS